MIIKPFLYRISLCLLAISALTSFYSPFVFTQEEGDDEVLVVAFLDSGINTHSSKLRDYTIYSFDLTGEGSQDVNGHGTVVTHLFLEASEWMDPSQVEILNIKILDQALQTDEVRILQGLSVAYENGASMVYLSSGVWLDTEAALLPSKKFVEFCENHPDIFVIISSVGQESFYYESADILFPQSSAKFLGKDLENVMVVGHLAQGIVDPKENEEKKQVDSEVEEVQELPNVNVGHEIHFQEAVKVAETGHFEEAHRSLTDLILLEPGNELEAKSLRIMRGMFFINLTYDLLQKGERDKAKRFLLKAEVELHGLLDFDKIVYLIEAN